MCLELPPDKFSLPSPRSDPPVRVFRAANHSVKSIPNGKTWKAERLRHRPCLQSPVANIRDLAFIGRSAVAGPRYLSIGQISGGLFVA
jgi:hypothetical protein